MYTCGTYILPYTGYFMLQQYTTLLQLSSQHCINIWSESYSRILCCFYFRPQPQSPTERSNICMIWLLLYPLGTTDHPHTVHICAVSTLVTEVVCCLYPSPANRGVSAEQRTFSSTWKHRTSQCQSIHGFNEFQCHFTSWQSQTFWWVAKRRHHYMWVICNRSLICLYYSCKQPVVSVL